MLAEPRARSLLQTKLKIQRRVGTRSCVINKFTQKVDTRACGLWVPRAIMAPQTCFGSPTFAPDLKGCTMNQLALPSLLQTFPEKARSCIVAEQ